jgi:hypothetical protein
MSVLVFCVITPCGLAGRCQRFCLSNSVAFGGCGYIMSSYTYSNVSIVPEIIAGNNFSKAFPGLS